MKELNGTEITYTLLLLSAASLFLHKMTVTTATTITKVAPTTQAIMIIITFCDNPPFSPESLDSFFSLG